MLQQTSAVMEGVARGAAGSNQNIDIFAIGSVFKQSCKLAPSLQEAPSPARLPRSALTSGRVSPRAPTRSFK